MKHYRKQDRSRDFLLVKASPPGACVSLSRGNGVGRGHQRLALSGLAVVMASALLASLTPSTSVWADPNPAGSCAAIGELVREHVEPLFVRGNNTCDHWEHTGPSAGLGKTELFLS